MIPGARVHCKVRTRWYAIVMTVQLTVRIPDRLAKYIDDHVAAGDAPNRTAVITRALEELERAERARREVETLAALQARGEQPYPDLASWVERASRAPLDID